LFRLVLIEMMICRNDYNKQFAYVAFLIVNVGILYLLADGLVKVKVFV